MLKSLTTIIAIATIFIIIGCNNATNPPAGAKWRTYETIPEYSFSYPPGWNVLQETPQLVSLMQRNAATLQVLAIKTETTAALISPGTPLAEQTQALKDILASAKSQWDQLRFIDEGTLETVPHAIFVTAEATSDTAEGRMWWIIAATTNQQQAVIVQMSIPGKNTFPAQDLETVTKIIASVEFK